MPDGAHGALAAPSAWVESHAHLFAPGSTILDLACGGGRHARWLAARGHTVLAVDRDAAALSTLAGVAGVETREADLEQGSWPLGARRFGGIVVTHYLHRPLFPHLLAALAPGGVIVYETFGVGNARFGRPSNPAFLLEPGELLARLASLQIVSYQHGIVGSPPSAVVQRICARRNTPEDDSDSDSATIPVLR